MRSRSIWLGMCHVICFVPIHCNRSYDEDEDLEETHVVNRRFAYSAISPLAHKAFRSLLERICMPYCPSS